MNDDLEEQTAKLVHQTTSKYNSIKGGKSGKDMHYIWMRIGFLTEFPK
jgi:hypothetical protein